MRKFVPIHMTEDDILLFWSNVNIKGKDDCWMYMGCRNRAGYGKYTLNGKNYYANRVSLTLKLGRQIVDGHEACHSCDNTPCVNPYHLNEKDHFGNMQEMASRGRQVFQKDPSKAARGLRNGVYTRPETRAYGLRNGRHTKPERTARGERSGARTHPQSRPRGDNHGGAIVTSEIVIQIREMYTSGNYLQRELAEIFGVTQMHVSQITRGKIWKHLLPTSAYVSP